MHCVCGNAVNVLKTIFVAKTNIVGYYDFLVFKKKILDFVYKVENHFFLAVLRHATLKGV